MKTLVMFALLFTFFAPNNVHAAFKGDMIYWEDFENLAADFWQGKPGESNPNETNWSVKRDLEIDSYTYYQKETDMAINDPYVNDWSLYTADEFREYTLTLKAKSSESLVTNPAAELGVLFHYQDEDNYYYFHCSSQADSSVLIKKVAGENKVLARCASPIIEDNDYFAIAIKSINGKIIIMAHDIVIFQVYDDTFVWGQIGLAVKDDTAYFDDIVICKLYELDVEFYQDFNDNALTGWRAHHKERWSTSFKNHSSYSLYLHTNEYDPWNRSLLGEIITIDKIEARDFKFECDLKTTSGDTARDLALVFCYYDESNYYAAIFHQGKGKSRILRVKNGLTSILATYDGRCLEDYEWHEATVIGQDDHYQVYYDANKIMEITDKELSVGKVGFGSLNNTGFFDNVTVEGEGIVQEKITLGSPNGTENLRAGTIHRINWISEHISNNVALEYTLNNGTTWQTITSSVFNEYQFDWLVPNVNSTRCRVRVKDVDEYPVDESDRIFTILPSGSITITSPASGDVYYADDLITIGWSSSHTSGLIDIEFSSNGGTTWSHVAQDTEDDGQYVWAAPHIDSQNCLIRVSDADDFPTAETEPFTIREMPPGTSVIQPQADAEQVAPGNDVWIAVSVGDDNYPVQDLFGVSYNLTYGPTQYVSVVQPTSENIKIGDFLGTDVVHFEQDDGAGIVSAGITRKSGAGGVSGAGELLLVQFHVDENTPEDIELSFSLSDVSANTETGSTVELQPRTLVLTINNGVPVWPGDTNNDGIVDEKDILPIGQYWNAAGEPRAEISMLWQEYMCPEEWTPKAATYVDCNGSGVVEAADVLAIGLNWHKTHSVALAKRGGSSDSRSSTSSMSLQCQGQGTAENPFYVDVQVNEVADLLGVSFNLQVQENADYVIFNSVQYSEFFGSDLITFESIDNETATVSVGATRKAVDGGIQGTGSICRVYFTLKEETPNMQLISFEMTDVTANDSRGTLLALEAETASIMTGVEAEGELPTDFVLQQNYPNPFNPSTRIDYTVPAESHVTLRIYNSLGQIVKTLVDNQSTPGRYSILWDGTSDSGLEVSPGLYIARLQNSEHNVQLIKMVFAK